MSTVSYSRGLPESSKMQYSSGQPMPFAGQSAAPQQGSFIQQQRQMQGMPQQQQVNGNVVMAATGGPTFAYAPQATGQQNLQAAYFPAGAGSGMHSYVVQPPNAQPQAAVSGAPQHAASAQYTSAQHRIVATSGSVRPALIVQPAPQGGYQQPPQGHFNVGPHQQSVGQSRMMTPSNMPVPANYVPSSRPVMSAAGGQPPAMPNAAGAMQQPAGAPMANARGTLRKRRRVAERVLSSQVRALVPESQAYLDLVSFEKKLDATIMRKKLEIQEALNRPLKVKRKLRITLTNTFHPVGEQVDGSETVVPSWELRIEGRLLDEDAASSKQAAGASASNAPAQAAPGSNTAAQPKRKFSSYFKSLVIELDRDLYGPDNHLVEWHRSPSTSETDGFQVKRPGDKHVRCNILIALDQTPTQFRVDERLARVIGLQQGTRQQIIAALWNYVRQNRLQSATEPEFVELDRALQNAFDMHPTQIPNVAHYANMPGGPVGQRLPNGAPAPSNAQAAAPTIVMPRLRFSEIPGRLHALLQAAPPIAIQYVIVNDPAEPRRSASFDVDVEIDDALRGAMIQFLAGANNAAASGDIQALEAKIFDTIETIQQLKVSREFFVGFSNEPHTFIRKWLVSQARDLQLITDSTGAPDAERRADFYNESWVHEAVWRYLYNQIQQKRLELEQALAAQRST